MMISISSINRQLTKQKEKNVPKSLDLKECIGVNVQKLFVSSNQDGGFTSTSEKLHVSIENYYKQRMKIQKS